MTKPWDGIISEDEQRAYRAAGFGRPTGFGTNPALLIIDVQYRTTGVHGCWVLRDGALLDDAVGHGRYLHRQPFTSQI